MFEITNLTEQFRNLDKDYVFEYTTDINSRIKELAKEYQEIYPPVVKYLESLKGLTDGVPYVYTHKKSHNNKMIGFDIYALKHLENFSTKRFIFNERPSAVITPVPSYDTVSLYELLDPVEGVLATTESAYPMKFTFRNKFCVVLDSQVSFNKYSVGHLGGFDFDDDLHEPAYFQDHYRRIMNALTTELSRRIDAGRNVDDLFDGSFFSFELLTNFIYDINDEFEFKKKDGKIYALRR